MVVHISLGNTEQTEQGQKQQKSIILIRTPKDTRSVNPSDKVTTQLQTAKGSTEPFQVGSFDKSDQWQQFNQQQREGKRMKIEQSHKIWPAQPVTKEYTMSYIWSLGKC